jgi:hypothetical protein
LKNKVIHFFVVAIERRSEKEGEEERMRETEEHIGDRQTTEPPLTSKQFITIISFYFIIIS